MQKSAAPKLIVWWVLWAAFLAGLPQYYIFLSPKNVQPSSNDMMKVAIAVVPLLISVGIRWFALPRITDGKKAFAAVILGIAFAEAVCFIGLFIVPSYKNALFALSALGILQFAPFYAAKYQAPPVR